VTRRRRWLWSPLLLLLVVVTSACGSGDPKTPPPFADCAALTAQSGGAGGAADVSDVPDLRLPCFTGGEQVALRAVQGPAVINLWASWCGPCRAELPVMQQLAEQSAGKLRVLGIDTGDSREAGASFATAKGVRFPTLFDEDRKALNSLTGTSLPITVFVDATGKAYVHRLPLDARTLVTQVKAHTGVTVTL
jgi:cytochrome c biogenesis protein CcmG/thiol:disulfide interchange protein DsbE